MERPERATDFGRPFRMDLGGELLWFHDAACLWRQIFRAPRCRHRRRAFTRELCLGRLPQTSFPKKVRGVWPCQAGGVYQANSFSFNSATFGANRETNARLFSSSGSEERS